MSVNKTIGGLSVLSSANIKGCFSLPVWDSDAQTTKSACINDLVSAGGNIFTAGTGANSSIRCGVNNLASGDCSASLGGCSNTASGRYSVVLGGGKNNACGDASAVVSGICNCTTTVYTFVGGGQCNKATALYSSVLGGITNCATGARSVVGGGTTNKALGMNSGVLSGANNSAVGDYSVVSGGSINCVTGTYGSILGGVANRVLCNYGVIVGGDNNRSIGIYSSILSGTANCIIASECSAILQGSNNSIITFSSYYNSHNTIGNGFCNKICTLSNTISGQYDLMEFNTIENGCTNVISSTTSGYACVAEIRYNTILNGCLNTLIHANGATQSSYNNFLHNSIIGGCRNIIRNTITSAIDDGQFGSSMCYNTILGGALNCMVNCFTNATSSAYGGIIASVITGGRSNQISVSDASTPSLLVGLGGSGNHIGAGLRNRILLNCDAWGGSNNSISSGLCNLVASSSQSFIGSGCCNSISLSCSNAILGGVLNTITSVHCSMAFGESNVVAHNYAGAIGCGITSVLACALHTNRMVVQNMPTSSAGLPSGTLYSDAGTIKIVP